MRTHLRVLITATTLAALGTLGLAYGAHAVPAPTGGGNTQQHAPGDGQAKVWRCNAGHGPQLDCPETSPIPGTPPSPSPATTPAGGGRLNVVRSVVLLGLLVTLAAAGTWLRRHHRPREAI